MTTRQMTSSLLVGPSRLPMGSFGVVKRSLHITSPLMSGSNKWSKIKHTKEKNDSKRGTGYSNLSREIIAAVRNHPTRSTSVETNPKLSLLLKRAKAMDVPKDKLDATFKKAELMGKAGADGQMVSYEALGPTANNGQPVALIVECQTDSPGRTHARVKEAFNKNGLRISSAQHMFQNTGIIRLQARKGFTFDNVFEVAVENGAEDVREWEAEEFDGEDGEQSDLVGVEVACSPSDVSTLTSILAGEPHQHTIIESQAMMLPLGPPILIHGTHDPAQVQPDESMGTIGWLGEESITKLNKALDMLEENADCTKIWSNIEDWPSR